MILESHERAAEVVRRRRVERVNGWVSSLLILGITMVVNWLAFRHYERWDWTADGIYTLSQRTVHELEALPQDVHVYVFLSEAEPNYEELKELITRYRSKTQRIDVTYVDPDRDPAQYKVLAQRLNVGTAMNVETKQQFADVAVVVESKSDKDAAPKRWSVTRDDLVGFDPDSVDDEDTPLIDVKSEQALTGAIVQVVSGEDTKVCVTSGHGEWGRGGDEPSRTLFPLEDEFRRNNIELEVVSTLGKTKLPDDCGSLFVISPLRAFQKAEVELVRGYIESGGNALFALDPIMENEGILSTGFEDMFADWGVSIDASVVLELSETHLPPPPRPAGPFVATDFGDHAVTQALRSLPSPVVFEVARSVRPTRDGPGVLVRTTSDAYAETSVSELAGQTEAQRGEGDVDGPVPLGVAFQVEVQASSEEPAKSASDARGRVIVFGDSDIMAKTFLGPNSANRDLVEAATGWLTSRSALIEIAPKKREATRMTITDDDLTSLFFRFMVLIPGAILVLGFSTWFSRRQ